MANTLTLMEKSGKQHRDKILFSINLKFAMPRNFFVALLFGDGDVFLRTERKTGLEPATYSLGSYRSTR